MLTSVAVSIFSDIKIEAPIVINSDISPCLKRETEAVGVTHAGEARVGTMVCSNKVIKPNA